MLFASLTFLLGFLPAVAIASAWISQRFGTVATLVFLCAASFLFYGWHYPPYILLLLGSIGANYLLAQLINREKRRASLVIGVAFNLGLLGWFKYAGFVAEMVETLSGSNIALASIVLPLGISFFTFQQIAYLVDIYQGKAQPGRLLHYVFFISFFPQLIAGPIVHHDGFIRQIDTDRFAAFRASDIAAGSLMFCIGLAKKVLIADNLAPGADTLFLAQELGVPISAAESWLGMVCYTFQIYFDFSGYTDMALGLGLIFGLQLPQNFRSPYKSPDIITFWRRWNMTLSTFLRDYLYYPLGGNRKGPVRRYANLWIVMLLGGLWHGAGLQFIMWGALHGFYLTVNHWWHRTRKRALPAVVAHALTLLAVIVAWVFFRAADVGQGFAVLGAMLGAQDAASVALEIFEDVPKLLTMVAVAAALAFGASNTYDTVTGLFDRGPSRTMTLAFGFAGVVAALSIFQIFASGSYAFIYFQF